MKRKNTRAVLLALLAGIIFGQPIFAQSGPPAGGIPPLTPMEEKAVQPEEKDNHLQKIFVPREGSADSALTGETKTDDNRLDEPGDEAPDVKRDEWKKPQGADRLKGRESIPQDIGDISRSSYFQVTLDPNMGTFPGMRKGETKSLEIAAGEAIPTEGNIPYRQRNDEFSDVGGMILCRAFKGWYVDEIDLEIPAGEPYFPEGDVTLLACWEEDSGSYTVTLRPDERDRMNEPLEIPGVPGNSVIWDLPSWLLAGHAPVGWEVETEAETEPWAPGQTKVLADMILRPVYDVEQVTVTFRPGNGSPDVVQKIVKGEQVPQPAPDPIWEGRRFLYWAGPQGKFDFAIPPEADLTLTGVWEQIPEDSGGTVSKGASARDNGSGSSGGGQPLLTAPVRNPEAAFQLADERMGVSRMVELIQRNAREDVVLKGKNVTFRFAKGTMRLVPGKEVYDFGVSFTVEDRAEIEKAAGPALALTIHYNYSGALPAQAEITVDVGKEYAGQTLYYYYYNADTGALEFVQSAKADGEGRVTVRQTHCSDYAFLTVNLYEAERAEEAEGLSHAQAHWEGRKLPDAGAPAPWLPMAKGGIVLALSLCCLGKVFSKNKKREELASDCSHKK